MRTEGKWIMFYHTGLKFVPLMERRETSSTLGLKTASWALLPESERRLSQGESWVWLKKNDSFVENARPKVKPSLLWILVSKQGLNTSFVSLEASATSTIIINTMTIIFFTIVVVVACDGYFDVHLIFTLSNWAASIIKERKWVCVFAKRSNWVCDKYDKYTNIP